RRCRPWFVRGCGRTRQVCRLDRCHLLCRFRRRPRAGAFPVPESAMNRPDVRHDPVLSPARSAGSVQPAEPDASALALADRLSSPVIPVIVVADAADAVPLARALLAGGVQALEVTLRTPAGL